MEIWHSIPESTGYEASSYGRIRSIYRRVYSEKRKAHYVYTGKIIACIKNVRSDYLESHIYVNKCRKCVKVHRAVCSAFHGKPPTTKHTVNHIDGDTINNCATNLEWCTQSYNNVHAYTGLKRVINTSRIKSRPCIVTNKKTLESIMYASIESASRSICISPTQIRRLLCGECSNVLYDIMYAVKEGSETIEIRGQSPKRVE